MARRCAVPPPGRRDPPRFARLWPHGRTGRFDSTVRVLLFVLARGSRGEATDVARVSQSCFTVVLQAPPPGTRSEHEGAAVEPTFHCRSRPFGVGGQLALPLFSRQPCSCLAANEGRLCVASSKVYKTLGLYLLSRPSGLDFEGVEGFCLTAPRLRFGAPRPLPQTRKKTAI